MFVPHESDIRTKSCGPNYKKTFEPFFKKKKKHFWQSVGAILENVSATETIV